MASSDPRVCILRRELSVELNTILVTSFSQCPVFVKGQLCLMYSVCMCIYIDRYTYGGLYVMQSFFVRHG